MAVNGANVRPVSLDRDDVEAALGDQFARDAGSHPVKLAGAVGRFADQDNSRRADPLEQGLQIGGSQIVEWLAVPPDDCGELVALRSCGIPLLGREVGRIVCPLPERRGGRRRGRPRSPAAEVSRQV
jgi:hypothetical protein